MALVYSTEGYFCEGEVLKDWKFSMEYGRIVLSALELLLLKKSNINLTERGSSVDNYKEGFVIPLTQIIKAYSTKIQKIYVVVIETRDDLLFSITLANDRSIGRLENINLSEMINSSIILARKASKKTKNADDNEVKPLSNKCVTCGEEISYNWKFCKNCGKEL